MQERKEKGLELTVRAIGGGAVNCDEKGIVKAFWLSNFCRDFETAHIASGSIPEPVPVFRQLNLSDAGSGEDRSKWTLNNCRRKAPVELKNNPDLYKRLPEKEKN